MTRHVKLRLGAWALVLIILVLLGGSHLCDVALDRTAAEPGMRPIGAGALACGEFWLNRYQTLIGAGAAVFAGWLAFSGARGQIEAANRQLPLLRQQAAAVRASKISEMLQATLDLASVISNYNDELFRTWGILNVIRAAMNVHQNNHGIIAKRVMDADIQHEVEQTFDKAMAGYRKLFDLSKTLNEFINKAQINPALRISSQCARQLLISVNRIDYQIFVLNLMYRSSPNEGKNFLGSLEAQNIDWHTLQPLLNEARGELENSVDYLREELERATDDVLSKVV